MFHGAVAVAGVGKETDSKYEFGSEKDEVKEKEEEDESRGGDEVVGGPAFPPGGAAAIGGSRRGMLKGPTENMVDVLECCGSGWGGRFGIDGE